MTPLLAIQPVPDMAAIAPRWTALAEASGNPFATHEWAAAWWKHRSRGSLDLRLVLHDGRAIAILPLFTSAGRLRFLGDGDSDIVEPVCAPADRDLAATALRQVVAEGPSVMLDARWMPADHPWTERLGGVVLEKVASPELRIEGRSWDEVLAARSANFRSQVRRRRRSLDRSFSVTIRASETPEELEADLEILFSLHALRFGAASSVFTGARAAMHRDWAAAALARGWLRLWTLALDGEPAAALYVFRFGGVDWFYQSGRDPRFERERVGFVLLTHAIADACQAGQDAFSLLRGGEAYKDRFADADPGLQRVAVTRGVPGDALLTAARARRWASSVRARMR